MQNEALIGAIAICIVFPIMGIIWKKYPPKTINHLYGYRTSKTMANQEIWDYANQIGAKMFLVLGTLLIAVTIICYFLFPKEIIYVTLFSMLLGIGIGIFWCEMQLNKHFDKNGNQKTKL